MQLIVLVVEVLVRHVLGQSYHVELTMRVKMRSLLTMRCRDTEVGKLLGRSGRTITGGS